jgi:hypothetical protein
MSRSRFSFALALALAVVAAVRFTACTTKPDRASQSASQAATPVPAPSSYGTSAAHAVEVCKPAGERKYLQRLRCPDGSVPSFKRSGSGGSRTTPKNRAEEEKAVEQMFRDGSLAPTESDYHVVDIYDVKCGADTTEVIMDMYHCHQPEPTDAPPGFTIVPRR